MKPNDSDAEWQTITADDIAEAPEGGLTVISVEESGIEYRRPIDAVPREEYERLQRAIYRRPVDLPVLQRVTPEAMAELEADFAAGALAPAPGSRDGFLLIGRRQLRSNNSWMHNCPSLIKGPERCTLLMSPADAARLGLEQGSMVSVESRVGRVSLPLVVTDEMMPGVVSMPHGFGHDRPGIRARHASAQIGRAHV